MSIFIIPRKSKWCGEVHEVFIKKQETMIPTKELMLGNWVYNNDVQCIPMTVTLIEDGHVYLDFPGNEGDPVDGDADKLAPIPLTADLLVRNGFQKRKILGYDNHFSYEYYQGTRFVITALFDCEFSTIINDKARRINNVHQLQNLMLIVGIDINFKM